MQHLLDEAKSKQKSLVQVFKGVDSAGQRLTACFDKAQMTIAETAHLLQQLIEEQRQQALRDLENAYTAKQVKFFFYLKNFCLHLFIKLLILKKNLF